MGRRFAAQMGAPLTAQSIEIAALETRHDRQNGDNRAAAKPPTLPPSDASLPALLWLPCGACRSRRPLRLGFGVTAAVHCLRLDHAISAAGRSTRDPVYGLPGADPLAGHRISS